MEQTAGTALAEAITALDRAAQIRDLTGVASAVRRVAAVDGLAETLAARVDHLTGRLAAEMAALPAAIPQFDPKNPQDPVVVRVQQLAVQLATATQKLTAVNAALGTALRDGSGQAQKEVTAAIAQMALAEDHGFSDDPFGIIDAALEVEERAGLLEAINPADIPAKNEALDLLEQARRELARRMGLLGAARGSLEVRLTAALPDQVRALERRLLALAALPPGLTALDPDAVGGLHARIQQLVSAGERVKQQADPFLGAGRRLNAGRQAQIIADGNRVARALRHVQAQVEAAERALRDTLARYERMADDTHTRNVDAIRQIGVARATDVAVTAAVQTAETDLGTALQTYRADVGDLRARFPDLPATGHSGPLTPEQVHAINDAVEFLRQHLDAFTEAVSQATALPLALDRLPRVAVEVEQRAMRAALAFAALAGGDALSFAALAAKGHLHSQVANALTEVRTLAEQLAAPGGLPDDVLVDTVRQFDAALGRLDGLLARADTFASAPFPSDPLANALAATIHDPASLRAGYDAAHKASQGGATGELEQAWDAYTKAFQAQTNLPLQQQPPYTAGQVAALLAAAQALSGPYAQLRHLLDGGSAQAVVTTSVSAPHAEPWSALLAAFHRASPDGALVRQALDLVPQPLRQQWRTEGRQQAATELAAAHHATAVFAEQFPELVGALGRGPDAGELLPLVRATLDPAAVVVIAQHLTTLDDLARAARQRAGGGRVDFAAVRHEQVFVELGLDDAEVRRLNRLFKIGRDGRRWDAALDAVRIQQEMHPTAAGRTDRELLRLRDAVRLARSLGDLPRSPGMQDLRTLINRTVAPGAPNVTAQHVAKLIGGIKQVSDNLLRLRKPVTVRALERHFIRQAGGPTGADGRRNREAERQALKQIVPDASRGELDTLIRLRRSYEADPRKRGYDATAPDHIRAYRELLLEFHGKTEVSNRTITELVDLVAAAREARGIGIPHLLSRAELANYVTGQWTKGPPPAHPSSPAHDQFNAKLSRNQNIVSVDMIEELTAWVNRLVPGAKLDMTPDRLLDSLRSGLNSALDEGMTLIVKVGDRRVSVKLFFDVVAEPGPGQSKPVIGKEEERSNVYTGSVVTDRIDKAWSYGAGPYVRYGPEVHGVPNGKLFRASLYGLLGLTSTGGQTTRTTRQTGELTYFKLDDSLSSVNLQVQARAVLTDLDGRGHRVVTFADPKDLTGAAKTINIELYTLVSLKPVSGPAPTEHPITSNEDLPLWRMHHGVEGVRIGGKLLPEIRTLLGEEMYEKFESKLEVFFKNDSMGHAVAGAHRQLSNERDQQSTPRLMERVEAPDGKTYWLNVSVEAAAKQWSLFGTEAKQMFDMVNMTSIDQRVARGRSLTWRVLGSLTTRIADSLGIWTGGSSVNWFRGRQDVLRSWDYQYHTQRAYDSSRDIKLTSEYRVRLEFGVDGESGHVLPGRTVTLPVTGEAYVRLRSQEVPSTAPAATAQPATPPAAPKKSSDPPMWTLGPDAGMGHGWMREEGLRGLGEVYNRIVPELVRREILPPEAMLGGSRGQTPWKVLQGLSVTLHELNRPGEAYQNWRTLVNQLSARVLLAQVDNLTNGGRQPGVQVVLKERGHDVVVGLSARITGPGTHIGTENITPITVTTGLREVTTGRVKGGGWERRRLLGAAGGGDIAPGPSIPVGATHQKQTVSSRTDTTRANASATFIEYVRTFPHSHVYEVPIEWELRFFDRDGAVRLHETVSGMGHVVQGDSIAKAGAKAPPPLPPPVPGAAPSDSPLAGHALRGVVSVTGMEELQNRVIARFGSTLDKLTQVWDAINPVVFKGHRARLMSSGLLVNLDGPALWTALPVGKAQIVGYLGDVYTEGIEESQAGLSTETASQRTVTHRVATGRNAGQATDSQSGNVVFGSGTSRSEQTVNTAGFYRTPAGGEPMFLVATHVHNQVRLKDGTVIDGGHSLVHLLMSEVELLRGDISGFDDPQGLLAKSLAARSGSAPARVAPVALSEGRLGTISGESPVRTPRPGDGPLADAVAWHARRLGGEELVAEALGQISALEIRLPKLVDAGQMSQVNAGGKIYQLEIKARVAGDPAYAGENPKEVIRLYVRGNELEVDRTAKLRIGGGGVDLAPPVINSERFPAITNLLGPQGDFDSELMVWSYGRTQTTATGQERSHLLLDLEGVRPTGTATYVQPYEFSVTMSEVPRSLAAKLRPVRSESFAVTEGRIIKTPLDGTTVEGRVPVTPYTGRIRNVVPDREGVVISAYGLGDIYKAISEPGRLPGVKKVPYASQASETVLTSETFNKRFRDFLRPDGAKITGVFSGSGQLQVPQDTMMKITLGNVRHAYAIEKSEFEKYTTETHTVSPSRTGTARHTFSTQHTARVQIPDWQVHVGGRGAFAYDRTRGHGEGPTDSSENRRWLRNQQPKNLFYMYLDTTIEISDGEKPPVTIAGAIEIVVTRAGAAEMGIPTEELTRLSAGAPAPDQAVSASARSLNELDRSDLVIAVRNAEFAINGTPTVAAARREVEDASTKLGSLWDGAVGLLDPMYDALRDFERASQRLSAQNPDLPTPAQRQQPESLSSAQARELIIAADDLRKKYGELQAALNAVLKAGRGP